MEQKIREQLLLAKENNFLFNKNIKNGINKNNMSDEHQLKFINNDNIKILY